MKKDHWLLQKKITHRGLWDEQNPENSLGAFVNAIASGYAIELDVQIMHDGTLVIIHDRNTLRMTGMDMILGENVYEDIMHLRLQGSHHGIPRLQDALTLIAGKVPVVIEIKKCPCKKRKLYVQKIIETLQEYDGLYVVASFDPFLVKAIKREMPHVLCGQHFSDYADDGFVIGQIKKNSMYAFWRMSCMIPDLFICRASMLPRCYIVHCAQKYEVPLLAWHVHDDEEYACIKSVVNNEICDPDRL